MLKKKAKNWLIYIIKVVVPNHFINKIKRKRQRNKLAQFKASLRNNILTYHEANNDEEIKEVVTYLQKNPVSVFPYNFAKKYKKEVIEVYFDQSNGLRYVMHQNKRLYFKKNMTDKAIKSLYYGLLLDQDKNSPHLYITDNFNLDRHDVVADVGAAEGNFSLSIIESVRKIYLFEPDEEWIEPLKATFEPWKDKVVIINKFVTNFESESTISMNSFYKKNPDITFFKVDIEGEEQNFLNSCESILKKHINLKIAICTYHKQDDEKAFMTQLKSYGFTAQTSRGYMIYMYDKNLDVPYLRRGLIRAQKTC
ncbi:FkbM family methyltransferase [Flavivirga aquimarina]|uniref:FkbM family methyltransferase n=1 Tax=Flavivirga aquimarina TaxID=2027862 RepID=A0ABT8WC03_9FLAO|nr:FkbM family methyltransferase [Flavivirga aquimarina]MDO5970556.1 FkbM family methyltransferase [Flavivirga aquimarina]